MHTTSSGKICRNRGDIEAQLKQIVTGLTRLINRTGPDKFWFIFKVGFSESSLQQVLLPVAGEWRLEG